MIKIIKKLGFEFLLCLLLLVCTAIDCVQSGGAVRFCIALLWLLIVIWRCIKVILEDE